MEPMPFEEAIEYFREKTVLTDAEFKRLAEEIGEFANSRAFTVSRVASADVLEGLHKEILKAIEEGKTLGEFREAIDEIMERLGWDGLNPYRLDNLFRTNVQNGYCVGRHKQMKAIAERRPYWQYDAVNDGHARPSHEAHDGKVYHHLHPFWNTWYPLNGYRCRCKVNSLSAEEMKEEGLKEEKRGTDFKPDKGFRQNPAEKPWRPDTKKYPKELRRQVEKDIRSQ